jgi:hypothetical protein
MWEARRQRVTIAIRIAIPGWLERLVVPVVLLWRRLRYGYSFRRIPLTKGLFAIVDPDVYTELSRYRWHASRGRQTYYAQRKVWDPATRSERTIKMHRQILNCPPHLVVDHINHHGLDNRQANLRRATPAQNVCNTRRRGNAKSETRNARQTGTSKPKCPKHVAGASRAAEEDRAASEPDSQPSTTPDRFRGVSFHKQRRRYYARLRVRGETLALGYFDDPVEAALVRDAAAREHHGPFATLNFPHRRLLAVRGTIDVRITVRATLTVATAVVLR